MLNGLELDVTNKDYCLSDAEMAAYGYDEACPTGNSDGKSYKPTTAAANLYRTVFNDPLASEYPTCETNTVNGVVRHHSFNSLVGTTLAKINAVFAYFDFDPYDKTANFTQSDDPNCERDDSEMIIPADCPYTTASVFELYDLVYGSTYDGSDTSTQESSALGEAALYYKVIGEDGDLLKKPSQKKLDEIVAQMADAYHSLELKDADYESNFKDLFQEYFEATWYRRLSEDYDMGDNYLSQWETYFKNDTHFTNLQNFIYDYFTENNIHVLLPNGTGERGANGRRNSFPYMKYVEQKYIDGKLAGHPRALNNPYITDATAIADIAADFGYAEGTLCDQLCDLIDGLTPRDADYTEVFEMIARNIKRTVSGSTYYMVDPRTYSDDNARDGFYPSTASGVASAYSTWKTTYGNTGAWNATYGGHNAYDKAWLNKFYTEASVNALSAMLTSDSTTTGVYWGYNMLEQDLIDGKEGGAYKANTICARLQEKIDNLVPKTYEIVFYQIFETGGELGTRVQTTRDKYGNTLHYGAEVEAGLAFPLSGKTFAGWNTKADGTGNNTTTDGADTVTITPAQWDSWLAANATASNTTVSGAHTTIRLYAKWADNLTLTIVMSSGGSATARRQVRTVDQNNNNIVTSWETLPTITGTQSFTGEKGTKLEILSVSKTGYSLNEQNPWTITYGSGNTGSAWNAPEYTFGQGLNADTLTANWRPNTYKVVFNKNAEGATGTMQDQRFTYDTAQDLTANGFSWAGHGFTHWTTEPNGGTTYSNGQNVTNLTSVDNGTVTLYAQWEVTDIVLTFNAGEGVWQGWQAATTNANVQQKTVTCLQAYNKADTDGKTWPKNPVKQVETANGSMIKAAFLGWYTPSGTAISDVTAACTLTEDTTLTARFAPVDQLVTTVDRALTLNANHYTMASMKKVDAKLQQIFGSSGASNTDKAALEDLMTVATGKLELLQSDGGKPQVDVFENSLLISAELQNGGYASKVATTNNSTGDITYVLPGKAYYTYYCFTNSENPMLLVKTRETTGTGGRVSYPTTVAMDVSANSSNQLRTRSGKVRSGWMSYTEDQAGSATARKAGYEILSRTQASDPYSDDLTYFGSCYSNGTYEEQSGYSYYTHEQYMMLTPTFVAGDGKQYALYTFTVKDDSYTAADAMADKVTLAGADHYGTFKTGTDITDNGNANVTPENTITIFVEYLNTMNGTRTDNVGQVVDANGVGTYGGGKLEVYTKFHENGYDQNKWTNVDYLYRNSGGISDYEFVGQMRADDKGNYRTYIANDPIYGQNDVGSFYYLMSSEDEATTRYWAAYDAYLENHKNAYADARVAAANAAMPYMEAQVRSELGEEMTDSDLRRAVEGKAQQAVHAQNGEYISWPYDTSTQWYTQFYAPATSREDILVYVHLYDRWGNTYTNILQRELQDTQETRGLSATRGQIVLDELGGSGIRSVQIMNQTTNPKKGTLVQGISGMTDGDTWNASLNTFTVTGLPDSNKTYTMYVVDNAGGESTVNFRPATDGSVTVTVNDEIMGGEYAAAAAAPEAGSTAGDDVNGAGAGAIGEDALTMMAVEAVQPNEIAADTLDGVEAPATEEAELPEVYTFSLNNVYTVNLFNPTGKEYDVTLKSTAGGIVKAYVNGEFTPAKAGKVTIPNGAQVQIRVAARTGYELQSLVMIDTNGTTTSLVGTYNAEIRDNVTIKAVFTETSSMITVSVENGAIGGSEQRVVRPYTQVTVVANAAPEGKVFAYWTQDGQENMPVSYDEAYTFIATSNTTMTAVYADEPTEKTAGIVMDAADASHITVVNGAYTLSYSGKIIVPEGAQIEEYGMVLTNQSAADCTAENLVIGGSVNGVGVVKLTGSTLTGDGQCKLNVNNVRGGQTRTGRLFVTIRLADGTTQTLYSSTWSELITP